MEEIIRLHPNDEISVKIVEWYNWLYSQLSEYEGFVVCPADDTLPSDPEELLNLLDQLVYGDFQTAIASYLISSFIDLGRREGLREIRRLNRQVQREIRRATSLPV